jgi:hypothetical protein
MAANPYPNCSIGIQEAQRTVTLADARADDTIVPLQHPVSERRVMRVCLPEPEILLGESLNVRGQILE